LKKKPTTEFKVLKRRKQTEGESSGLTALKYRLNFGCVHVPLISALFSELKHTHSSAWLSLCASQNTWSISSKQKFNRWHSYSPDKVF